MRILQIGHGSMGKLLEEELDNEHDLLVVRHGDDIPQEKFDILIDFSHPDNLSAIINHLGKYPSPLVLATTGFSEQEEVDIRNLSQTIPLLYSGNYSIGIILMKGLIAQIHQVLGSDFDMELIEKHHNKKLDSPSGTAKMLLESVKSGNNEDYNLVYGRKGMDKRSKKEVGIHSIRGGSIVGEHEFIFAGEDEILSIKHEALSKKIFVRGAVVGMNWLCSQDIGLYSMEDVLFRGEI
jgi:dihydrodipicolinate reductase